LKNSSSLNVRGSLSQSKQERSGLLSEESAFAGTEYITERGSRYAKSSARCRFPLPDRIRQSPSAKLMTIQSAIFL
jgi:hypothetical protein